ncbi:MAG TPA: hypothetical protein VLI06_11145 [Solimonas sp.]|nr:hypothetical protein [Solimonas sp.]
MTTLRAFQKIADETFTSRMSGHGFTKIALGYYVRNRWPLHDVVWWYTLRSGESLRVYATCWTPAGYTPEALNDYPRCIGNVLGSEISADGFDRGVWEIGSPDAERLVLEALWAAIKQHAFPWFDEIQTADEYLEKFRWMRDLNRDFRERVKQELPGLFAMRGTHVQQLLQADAAAQRGLS